MSEELLRPDAMPGASNQSIGRLGSVLSAIGVLLMIPSLLGSAVFATIWAFGKLSGLPNWLLWPLHAIGGLLILAATIWTASRAWHVGRRIENGQGVDEPVFRLLHYCQRQKQH